MAGDESDDDAGYRDALEEGKEATLQQGFDIGFCEGAAAGFEWGLLRGAVTTLAAMDGQAAGTRQLHQEIVALHAAADVAPRAAMLATFRHLLASPMPLPLQLQQQQTQGQQQPELTAGGGGSGDARGGAGADSGRRGGGATGGEADTEATDLADMLGGLRASDASHRSQAESSPPVEPASGAASSAPAAYAYVLPPDAAALQLPDMPALMSSLRARLLEVGFGPGQNKMVGGFSSRVARRE
ncbi:hypothetical protein GPECTOR_5g389 [Gonium pectorale]|uniref:Essential protein Yae1 N-terminal domain-containing protein n=1 Tax=Gonium pectorale TaxID=33097 RepID=A0A150GX39_GONPE|nr:hypothetical protein GPECTOR_5g389 [Gonium pectorale]|eukprot:KXZ54303.1 hypothetical protein GPECTOR_5g389 [Gonium pectorale]